VIIMGEYHITVLTEWGDLSCVIPLPSPPLCGVLFKKAHRPERNLIVVDHNKTMRIYNDLNLIWASKLEELPVAVLVDNFG
jgi:hypothetical protein